MSSVFNAKYAGRCQGCDGHFDAGDFVKYEDDQLVHSDCDRATATIADFTVGPREVFCRSCFTFHAGECE